MLCPCHHRQSNLVLSHCPLCIRSVIVAWSTFDYEDADLDVMGHPLLNIIYYRCVVGVPLFLANWVSGATDYT